LGYFAARNENSSESLEEDSDDIPTKEEKRKLFVKSKELRKI